MQLERLTVKVPQYNPVTKAIEQLEVPIHVPKNETADMGTAFGLIYDLLAKLLQNQLGASANTTAGERIEFFDDQAGSPA